VHEVSRHLQHFYLKRGICQLTDHEYDMSMHIFCKYFVIILLIRAGKTSPTVYDP
jgi:hypothetical protein